MWALFFYASERITNKISNTKYDMFLLPSIMDFHVLQALIQIEGIKQHYDVSFDKEEMHYIVNQCIYR